MRSRTRSWSVLVACAAFIAALCLGVAAEEAKPPEIVPQQARDYVGKKVAVTMTVKASKLSKHGKGVFLDSEEQFTDKKNLGVTIDEKSLKKFAAAGIEAPHEHYHGKKIRVVGQVELREDRVYLPLDDPKHIAIREK